MESDGGVSLPLGDSNSDDDSDGLLDTAAAVAGSSDGECSDDGCSEGSREASADRAAAGRLCQRCVALLGSEELCEELLCLARAAAGDEGAASGATLADLSNQLFRQLGYSGHAAEALHLLLKMMYFEA
jgi:hypothetical protein